MTWLRRWFSEHRHPHTQLDLLSPALLAEVVIHVRADGGFQMFCSKNEASPEQMVHVIRAVIESVGNLTVQHAGFIQQPGIANVVMALVNGGVNLGQKYGIQVDFKPKEM